MQGLATCQSPVLEGYAKHQKNAIDTHPFQFVGVKLMTVQPLRRVPGVEDSTLLYRAREKLDDDLSLEINIHLQGFIHFHLLTRVTTKTLTNS